MATEPDLAKLIKKLAEATNRALFDARQATFGESIAADVYDDILAFFPVVGDVVGNGPRLIDAVAKEDFEAGAIHAADAAITVIPAVGFFAQVLIPSNTIIKGLECSRAKDFSKCAVPDGTFESELFKISPELTFSR